MIAENLLEVMFNCYGSHVLRRLLCLCKGVSLDSIEFHGTKTKSVLAERMNFKATQNEDTTQQYAHQAFPELLKFLVFEILGKSSKKDIAAMLIDQQCSLVLQALFHYPLCLIIFLSHNHFENPYLSREDAHL